MNREPERLIMRIRRSLPAPPDVVFAAWTDPAHVAEWMCPVPASAGPVAPVEATMDVRVGGRFSISMDHGGTRFTHRGEYVAIDPPTRLVFTWTVPLPDGPRSTLVTVTLVARGDDQTEMEVVHEHLPDEELRRRHEGGWSAIAERLGQHLAAEETS